MYKKNGFEVDDFDVKNVTPAPVDELTIHANNLLFLPAAGYRDGEQVLGVNEECRYWSVNPDPEDTTYQKAMALRITMDGTVHGIVSVPRNEGASVRVAITAPSN